LCRRFNETLAHRRRQLPSLLMLKAFQVFGWIVALIGLLYFKMITVPFAGMFFTRIAGRDFFDYSITGFFIASASVDVAWCIRRCMNSRVTGFDWLISIYPTFILLTLLLMWAGFLGHRISTI
jgi:hypothetical protein